MAERIIPSLMSSFSRYRLEDPHRCRGDNHKHTGCLDATAKTCDNVLDSICWFSGVCIDRRYGDDLVIKCATAGKLDSVASMGFGEEYKSY